MIDKGKLKKDKDKMEANISTAIYNEVEIFLEQHPNNIIPEINVYPIFIFNEAASGKVALVSTGVNIKISIEL
jgi:hypothetical protein